MQPKPFWTSKTLWLNVIAVIIATIQTAQGQAWIPAEWQVLILAVLNAIVRFLTSQPIEGTPAAKN